MLKTIRIFIKVVEIGSFSGAAQVLDMAPSSVSRCMDKLEDELDTTLFERSTRQLSLTEKGNIFYEGALALVSDADNLKDALGTSATARQGKLRISVFESFGRLHICPYISEFMQRYPKINLDIELDNRVVDLFSEDVDVSIRMGIPQDSQLKARTLLSNHTVICASPDYLLRCGTPQTPEQLQSHNCLILNKGRQRNYWYFCKASKEQKILITGNLKSSGGTPLLSAALQGGGIVQLSHWMVSDYIKDGQLAPLLEDWQPSLSEKASGQVYALYKPSKYPNLLIRLFIDFLLEKTQGLY
jgi:DNA-binding transcriptional LysR family regulator